MSDRPCTCHPDDNPPVPCPQKYALSECKAADALEKDRCNWTQDEEGHWDTTCGNRHTIIDGTPADNRMGYCCYCGLKLAQASYQGGGDE